MKVDLNHIISLIREESGTAVQKQSTDSGINGKYNLDFLSDTIVDMDKSADLAKNKNLVDENAISEGSLNKQCVDKLLQSLTEQDLKYLQDEGIDSENEDVKNFVTVMDKIKIQLALYCDDFQMYGSDISMSDLESVSGSYSNAQKLTEKLNEKKISAPAKAVSDGTQAFEQAKELTPITNEAKKYMVSNGLEPTIENLYKAQYSCNKEATTPGRTKSYTIESGYYMKAADAKDVTSLDEQLNKRIQESGIEVNETTHQEAKWLLQSGIPVNEQNINLLHDINSLSFPIEEEELLNKITDSMQTGMDPVKTNLSENYDLLSRAVDAYEVIQKAASLIQAGEAQTDAINMGADGQETKQVVGTSAAVSLDKQLATAAKQETELQATEEASQSAQSASTNPTIQEVLGSTALTTQDSEQAMDTEENSVLSINDLKNGTEYQSIKAKRQIEEIRLIMTVQANYQLLKQGINLETEPLEQVIEQLKEQEANYCKALLNDANADVSIDEINLFKETSTKLAALPQMPVDMIGTAISTGQQITIDSLYEQGSTIKQNYADASLKYEQMQTEIRTDLGDSIRKAFENVPQILESLGLEQTDANQRAVRILGYNSMEITEDSINQVKEADFMVNRIITQMTPAITLQLIRKGINPLNTDIEELNQNITDVKEETDESDDKYSKYLWKLEKSNGITAEEKEAYLGIYKMFYQIAKTDGSVIGSLLQKGSELNFRNLMTEVKSNQKRGLDITIDDDFGGLEQLISKEKTAVEQINSAFSSKSKDLAQNENSKDYQKLLAKAVLDELDPVKLQNINLEADTSVEGIYEMLIQEEEDSTLEKSYLKEKQEQIQISLTSADNAIDFLTAYQQPVTINSVMAAKDICNNKSSFQQNLKKFSSKFADNMNENGKNLSEQLDAMEGSLLESMESKEEFEDTLLQFDDLTDMILAYSKEYAKSNTLPIKEIQGMYNRLSLTRALRNEENYEIPITINDEVTAIHLKIIHKNSNEGNVTVSMESENLGKSTAQFKVSDNEIKGLIIADSEENKNKFSNEEGALTFGLSEIRPKVSITCITSSDADPNKFLYENSTEKNTEKGIKDLYKTAKQYISFLKDMEKN